MDLSYFEDVMKLGTLGLQDYAVFDFDEIRKTCDYFFLSFSVLLPTPCEIEISQAGDGR